MEEEHMHCRLNLHKTKEDDMQRKYDLHESGRFYLHCRLYAIIPITVDMQYVDYASTAIEAYMHRM